MGKLVNVKAKQQLDTRADTLAEVQDETHGNRLKDLEAKVLVTTMFYTLAEVEENHLATHLTKWRSRHKSKRCLTR